MTARQIVLPGVEDTQALGRALGALLRAGDLVVLTGGLGAVKTTLTQGLGDGLGVRGPVTSPTFVIARVHPSLVGVRGFEPPAPCSQNRCATRLRYTPDRYRDR